jgi:hypothetical protein
MARRRPSVLVIIAAVLAVAAAVWAVSLRTRPAFAVYDPMPARRPAGPAVGTGVPVPQSKPAGAGDSAAPARPAPMSAARPASTRATPPRAGSAVADSTGADSAAVDTAVTADTVHHHRSDNYGGYSGYGSKERRGTPNAR